MDEEKLRNRIQMAAPVLGVAVVLLYAVGFLALSLHHSSFGISQFSLLRPKIVAAGILFFVFAALPTVETLRILDLTGFTPATAKQSNTGSAPASSKSYVYRINKFAFLLMAMVSSAFLLRPYLADRPVSDSFYSWVLAAIPSAAILIAVPFVIPKMNKWGIVACLALIAGVVLWIAFCVYRARDVTFTVFIGWFLWCGYLTYQTHSSLREPQILRTTNWMQTVTLAMATAAFFGVQIYPRIPSGYGGGAPGQVTLEFTDKSPFDGATKSQVWLIDEADTGFYILRSKDAKKAIFIPRNAIRVIYFGQEPEQPKVERPQIPEKEQQQNAPTAKPKN